MSRLPSFAGLLVVLMFPALAAAGDDLGDCSGSNPDAVLVACSAIIKAAKHPRLAEAYANRAWALWNKGEFDRAIVDSDKAIGIDPEFPDAYVERAMAYYSKGDFDRAIADLDRAIELDPNQATAYHNRGAIYHKKGDLERAIADFAQAIALDPKNAFTYIGRGTALDESGQSGDALTDLRLAIDLLQPSSPWYESARKLADDLERRLAAGPGEAKPAAETPQDQLPAILPPSLGKRAALVIGNSAYENVQHLPNPEHDAGDLATLLATLGFEVTEAHDLDRVAMEEALSAFSDKATGADIALVFFAGHGMEVDHQNYLIPVDASLETTRRIPFETVSLDHVMAALEGVRGLRIVLLDACRNNPFAASIKATGSTRSLGRGLAGVEASAETLISFSAKEGAVAAHGVGRNSPYTAALLANLQQPGLEIGLMFRKVRDSVLAATDKTQEPFISASLSSDPIYLVPPSGGAALPPAPSSTALQARVMGLLVPVSLAGEAPSKALEDDFAGSVQDSVFFYVGEAVLTPEGQIALDTQARWLLANPRVRVRVYGNADEREGDALVLGAQRAKAVRDYLVGAGVPPDRVGSTTYGLDSPFSASSDEASWAMNRRVQTRLVSVSRD